MVHICSINEYTCNINVYEYMQYQCLPTLCNKKKDHYLLLNKRNILLGRPASIIRGVVMLADISSLSILIWNTLKKFKCGVLRKENI